MTMRRMTTICLALTAACCPGAQAQDRFQSGIPAAEAKQLEAIKSSYKATGNRDQAEDALKTLIARQPDYYAANYDLGLILADQGNYVQAINYLETAKSIREHKEVKDATIYNSLGWAYMLEGDTRNAESNFNAAKAHSELLPRESQARLYNNLGLLYTSTGRYDESREALGVASGTYGNKLASQNLVTLDRLTKQQAASAATK